MPRLIPTLIPMLLAAAPLPAQVRSLAQDSTLDNLRHSPGTGTVEFGTLGRVRTEGRGAHPMVLIPGIGFGDDVWNEFMERHRDEYTMYAVTLPGFGGTAPLPMPAEGVAYAETPWIRSAEQGILALLDRARLGRVTLVAHWAVASQIALRLALEHPERIARVVLVSGVLKSYYEQPPGMEHWTLEQRARFAEGMSQRWFRTVTRQTWDDNNFMPYDYAVNPRRGLFLWREAQAPALPVWIRYLLEWYAMDLTSRLADLRVPVLVIRPGLDDPQWYVEPGRNYMVNLTHDSWRGAPDTPRIRFVTIPGSRLFIQYDQPEALDRELRRFLAEPGG